MIFRDVFRNSEVSIDLDFAKIDDVQVLVTSKVSRICHRSRYVRVGCEWRPVNGKRLDPAMTHVLNHYSMIMYMEELIRSRSTIEREITKITDQEFDLDRRFQTNSFAGYKR